MKTCLASLLICTVIGVDAAEVTIDVATDSRRQEIDGFGGSIAFWGTAADDKALEAGVRELEISILRAQGEVTPKGLVDQNRDILQRAMKLNPDLQVLLTFWQPKSTESQSTDHWLNVKSVHGSKQFVIKPEMREAWADEMVARVKQYRDWGVNVTTIGVQNESNWSHPGTQTCRWEPEELRDFIGDLVRPRLERAGLQVALAAPDLAYIGHEASEARRFLPTLQSPDVDVVAYHMYDSYKEGMEKGLAPLIRNTRALGKLRSAKFPKKRLWMTETTGAQWNSGTWHTYGWTPELSEHGKAIRAAQYIHMTLVDAEANAFLWWGLVYSLAPANNKDPNKRQKHRDEGLVLVKETYENGRQPFLERTKKFYAFRQYSAFVKPGYRRLAVLQPEGVQLSAYLSPDESRIVAVGINDTAVAQAVRPLVADKFATKAWQTDKERNCEAVPVDGALPPQSVRTWIWEL
jgi:O-glycosyl hydrolase